MESDSFNTIHGTPTEAASPNVELGSEYGSTFSEPQTSNATQPASLDPVTPGNDVELAQKNRVCSREAIIVDAEFIFRRHQRRQRDKIDRTMFAFRGIVIDWNSSTVYNATQQQSNEA